MFVNANSWPDVPAAIRSHRRNRRFRFALWPTFKAAQQKCYRRHILLELLAGQDKLPEVVRVLFVWSWLLESLVRKKT